jgi:hypothetical protein
MPKRKSLTAEEQAEKFRNAAAVRKQNGLPSIAEAEDAVDEMIRKNVRDYGA